MPPPRNSAPAPAMQAPALSHRSGSRDAALVLSGGGINGILLELGFLKRLYETDLWPRIGWIYGTSAGALSGTMAALDRVDELEEFLLGLRAEEVFRPRKMWQLPLAGLHEYTLPKTIAERLGDPETIGADLAAAAVELVVFATDVSPHADGEGRMHFELSYSSRSTPNETMGRAILASAAISALVLPIRVDDVIATDGGWVRNFPLEYAEGNRAVHHVAAFRYIASYRQTDTLFLQRLRERLERFRAVPPVRALLAELRLAEERSARGEPAHYPELVVRLMRVAIARNTVLEERLADERDASATELHRLREAVLTTAVEAAPVWRRTRLRGELEQLFSEARFPFRHRHVPAKLVVRATPGDEALDPTFRGEWSLERKQALIERGYKLTDETLARQPAFLGSAGDPGRLRAPAGAVSGSDEA